VDNPVVHGSVEMLMFIQLVMKAPKYWDSKKFHHHHCQQQQQQQSAKAFSVTNVGEVQ